MEPTESQPVNGPKPGDIVHPAPAEPVAPSTPVTPVAPPAKPQAKGAIAAALSLFALAVILVSAIAPGLLQSLGNASDRPSVAVLALSGVIIILLTAGLLGFVQSKLRIGGGWFLTTLFYTAIIVGLKFILAPDALYNQTFQYGPGASSNFNPNDPLITILYTVGVFLIYLAIIYATYRIFKSRLPHDLRAPKKVKKPHQSRDRVVILLAIVVILALTGFWVFPLGLLIIVATATGTGSSYIGHITQNYGVILGIGIIVGMIAAFYSFHSAFTKAVVQRDATILALAFWVALCIVITYSIAGAIFVAALVKLWPFKSVYIPLSSSGK